MTTTNRARKRRRRFALGAVLVGVAVVVFGPWAVARVRGHDDCVKRVAPTATPESVTGESVTGTRIELEDVTPGGETPVPLGHFSSGVPRSYTVQTSDETPIPQPDEPLKVFVTQFQAGDKTMPPDAVHVTPEPLGETTYGLTLCFDAGKVGAGTYTGKILVDDSRFSRLAIDVTATRQITPVNALGIAMLLAGVAAAVWKYLEDERAKTPKPKIGQLWSRERFLGWAEERYASLAVGFVGVAGAFLTAVFNSPALGESPLALVTIITGSFGAVLGVLTGRGVVAPEGG